MAINSYIKRKNMLEVLHCFKLCGKLTKQELAEQTALTFGTINTFVNELLAIGLVQEQGQALSTGGRKASIYGLNPSSLFTIGVSISIERISIGLFDLTFGIVDYFSEKTAFGTCSVENIIDYIAEKIENIITNNNIKKGYVAGIGISVPGPVDFNRGVILELPHIKGWRNIPIKTILIEKINLPVMVDNDNNANVLYLKSNRENNNIVYLSTVEGIGVGITIDGKVYRGSRYFAGEIGHVSINPTGEKCSCGNYGCIELYASNLGIARGAGLLQNTDENADISTIIKDAQYQNIDSLQHLKRATDYIALCIDSIIKVYDPELIAVDSTWLSLFPNLTNHLLTKIFESSNFITRDDIKIEFLNEEKLFSKGAATLILDAQFDESNEDSLLWNNLLSKSKLSLKESV